jgi:hypothetical protein
MKNIINYYYNLKISDIKNREGIIYFFDNNTKYLLISYNKDFDYVSSVYELDQMLLQNGIFVHQIILNVLGQILTYINGEYFILLKVMYQSKNINLNDVLYLNHLKMDNPSPLRRNNWGELWSEKNDYLEYQVSQLGKKFPLIRNVFPYFLGISETCIALVNDLDLNNIPTYLSHNRIKSSDTTFELYNPLNLVLDYKVRDSAEYLKSKFFEEDDITEELNNLFIYSYFNYEEWVLFFARLMYPSYYFDLHEEIINGRKDEEKLKKIIDKINDYENVILKVYFHLRTLPNFPIIDYLENKKNII